MMAATYCNSKSVANFLVRFGFVNARSCVVGVSRTDGRDDWCSVFR